MLFFLLDDNEEIKIENFCKFKMRKIYEKIKKNIYEIYHIQMAQVNLFQIQTKIKLNKRIKFSFFFFFFFEIIQTINGS